MGRGKGAGVRAPTRHQLRLAAAALEQAAAMSEESSINDGYGTRLARDAAAPDREAWRVVASWLDALARS